MKTRSQKSVKTGTATAMRWLRKGSVDSAHSAEYTESADAFCDVPIRFCTKMISAIIFGALLLDVARCYMDTRIVERSSGPFYSHAGKTAQNTCLRY